MNEAFGSAIREAINQEASLEEIADILRQWRKRGLRADEASSTLELLREGAEEEVEDRLLEVMDIVAGFCRPELKVWDG